jgi:hypothetical protein
MIKVNSQRLDNGFQYRIDMLGAPRTPSIIATATRMWNSAWMVVMNNRFLTFNIEPNSANTKIATLHHCCGTTP